MANEKTSKPTPNRQRSIRTWAIGYGIQLLVYSATLLVTWAEVLKFEMPSLATYLWSAAAIGGVICSCSAIPNWPCSPNWKAILLFGSAALFLLTFLVFYAIFVAMALEQ